MRVTTALALLAAAAADSLGSVGLDAGGMQIPMTIGGKKVKRSQRSSAAADDGPSIPQTPGSGPILAPHSYLQFPGRVQPRSMAYAARRRAVMVTDGNPTYQKTASGLVPFLSKKEAPLPYAYVVDGESARCTYNMAFHKRKALPYGIAEDPRDGRVVVTFYQAQTDSVEVWQPDLSWKLTYHDVSLKPSIPFFYGGSGEMWIPFTIADRYMEETDRVLLMYIFRKDGQREETFPRRMWGSVKMPHTVRVDGAGRVWAAGLTTWAWDDGVHGPTPKELNETHTPPVRIDVYGLTSDDRAPDGPFVREQKERWYEQHSPSEGVPTREMLASTNTRYGLLPMASHPFPFTCVWPLFDLTPDGHVIAGCYDQDTIVVYRATKEARNPKAAPELLGELEEVARITRPYGITALGAITMDPNGGAFALLDRERGRVYAARWPLVEAELTMEGEAPVGRNVSHVAWHSEME